MASPAASTTQRGIAPWRKLFEEHVSKMKSPEFYFASQHTTGSSKEHISPRVRTCIYRGIFAQLPKNDKNTAPMNPDIYDSDMLTFTSDARMGKVPEIFGGGESYPSKSDLFASGGGGPVEANFWITDVGTQWRIRGRAYVLGPDISSTTDPRPTAVREALLPRMRKTVDTSKEAGRAEQWDWATEVTAHFGNVSPMMRGTFKNPPPGTPRSIPGPDGTGMGNKVESLDDKICRQNFRVVVIVPEEVDQADLSDSADPRRYIYTYVGPATKAAKPGGELIGEWEKVEVWP